MAHSLTQQQGEAVKKIIHWFRNETEQKQDFVLAGFAGTGKSTILPDFVDGLNLTAEDIAFAAPTGKAAKVMGEKLRSQGFDVYPTTIHSLIYTPKAQKASILERDLEAAKKMAFDLRNGHVDPRPADMKAAIHEQDQKIAIIEKELDRAYGQNDLRFNLNPDSKLITGKKKLVIIDEGSMVDEEMAEDILGFDVPVLVIGDPGQLPPVGGKPGFMNRTPDAFLTEVHRQALDNPIIYLATLIRKGKRGDYGDYGNGVLIVRPKDDIYTLDLQRDAQIIVGTNKKRWMTTSKLRKAAGFLTLSPQMGEPLIMCKNSKLFPRLVNGTQVFSAADHDELEPGDSRFRLSIYDDADKLSEMFVYQGLFEEHHHRGKGEPSAPKSAAFRSKITDNHVDFGWAITCHKAQGSQFDEVIVHDESHVFRQAADQWLYTATTRAAERLVIVAPE